LEYGQPLPVGISSVLAADSVPVGVLSVGVHPASKAIGIVRIAIEQWLMGSSGIAG